MGGAGAHMKLSLVHKLTQSSWPDLVGALRGKAMPEQMPLAGANVQGASCP